MEEKKISVIVPVYNADKYVKRCLDSITGQSYKNLEILLIDDGSTDESGKICDRFSEKDSRIKVYHIENSGVSNARNKGMKEASGYYLTFVDADDYIREDMICRLITMLEETGGDVAGCGYFAFSGNENGDADGNENALEKREVLGGKEFIEKGILASDTRCWSKLYRAEAIGECRFDTELTIGEDMLFLLDLAIKGVRFSRCTYKGYGYCRNESGAMNYRFQKSYMDQIKCWKKASVKMERELPEMIAKVTSIRMISAMLTVGKLAVLDKEEIKKQNKYIEVCLNEIIFCRKISGAFGELPAGYKIKVFLFSVVPWFYIRAYHLRKTSHKRMQNGGKGCNGK